jgi:hypothetical protein
MPISTDVAASVTIEVTADPTVPPFDRRGEPTTIGVEFGRGEAPAAQMWSLTDERGQRVAVQALSLDHWADGSVRWLLVDFQADVSAGGASRYELRPAGGPHDTPQSPLQVDVAEQAITIRTGAAEFQIGRTGHALFSSVSVGGVPVLDPAASGIVATDVSGASHRLAITDTIVERSGPLRTVVRVDARLPLDDDATVDAVARLHFFAGSGTVRVEFAITNPRRAEHRGGFWDLGDPGSVCLRDLSMVWAAPGALERIAYSVDAASPFVPAAAAVEIYQDSSGGEQWRSANHVNRVGAVPLAFRGCRIGGPGSEPHGDRATPIVCAVTAGVPLAFGIPEFWQNFPKAIEADSSSITLRLFPRQSQDVHELQGGERKTHTLYLCVGPERVTDLPLHWSRSPVLAMGDRSRYRVAGSWQPLHMGSEDAREAYEGLVNAAIDGPDSFVRKREAIDEYGWRHFGDIYADHEAAGHPGLISHYNNQYDAIAGCATRFCETGDRRWWGLMNDLARHVADIDIYHCAQDKPAYNHGMFWHTSHYAAAHTATHRSYSRAAEGASGGPSNEHNYTSGLLLHYFLTGSEQSREAVLELASWVLDMDDGAKARFWWLDRGETGLASATREADYHGPGRGAAYSINALLDAHRLTGEARYLTKADRLIARCISPADDPDALGLLDAERRWSYTVFLQVLGKYLDYRVESDLVDAPFDYARAALLHYAEWMAEHERPYLDRPEQLEYPTETWAAQDVRKAAVFEFAAAYAEAGERRERFLDRAHRFFNYAVTTLEAMPTRTLARPIVLLLAYGFQRPLSGHVDAVAVRPFPDVMSRTLPRFVPYRRRVLRKAAGLAAAMLVLFLAVAALWLMK